MTKITVDKAMIDQVIDAAFSPYCAQALGILVPALRAALAEPAVETDDPLHCDLCGDATDDPWHFSTSQDRHKHACDKCWESLKESDTICKPPAEVPLLTHGEVWAIWNGEIGVDQMNQQEAFKFAGFIETLVRQKAVLTNKPKE